MDKEKKTRIKKVAKTATITILDAILGIAESLTLIGASRRELYSVLQGENVSKWTVENICRSLQSLKQRGYIEIINDEHGGSIHYTDRAKLKMVDKIAEKMPKDNSMLRFISFDIPEQLKSQRDHFRMIIKRLGFKQVQKSLWVSNKNVAKLVELAAEDLKIADFIIYIVSTKTNIDKTIINKLKNGKICS